MPVKTRMKVETVDEDEKPLVLEVRIPDPAATKAADLAYAVEHARLVSAGVLLRDELLAALEARGLMAKLRTRYEAVQDKIAADAEFLPDEQGQTAREGTTLEEARAAAVRMRAHRMDELAVLAEQSNVTATSVERLASDHRFATLVVECTLDASGKRKHFENLDGYLRRIDKRDGIDAAQKLAELMSGAEGDKFFAEMPENKFLLKYKLANEKLELVDDAGRQVDADGKVIETAEAPKRFALIVPETAPVPAVEEAQPSPTPEVTNASAQ